jgi:hypothetical protein
MRDNKVVGPTAALVILGSVLTMVFSFSGGLGPPFDPSPHEAAGRVLARQTLSLLKPGGQVIVIARDTVTFKAPASEAQLAAFRKELTKAGAKIDSIQFFEIDPNKPLVVPADDFIRFIRSATNGSVIVSLMGPPILTDAQVTQLGHIEPAIVAFCPGAVRNQVDLRSLFAQGSLKAAVVSKPHASIARGPAENEQDTFDRQFIEVTPTNLAALSTPSP